TLQDYMKIYQKTPQNMYDDYREASAQTVQRSLVLRELADAEQLEVTEEGVDNQIEKLVGQFGEDQRDTIRQMFLSQPNMRDSVRSDLLRDEVLDRIIAIAKGEAPTITKPEAPELEAPKTDEVTSENKEEST
ncbi:MAG: hypothetical protein ABI700_19810, partial [Chloroflexota bacterium]